jgi:hypothetical protein
MSITLPKDPRQVYVDPLNGTKKRRVMTSDLIGKFRSKTDFIKYLTENRKNSQNFPMFLCPVQLYVPPAKMINKDFLKQVFRDEKKLLRVKDVKYVNMPHYDELSVKKYWPILRQDTTLMTYMPDPIKENKIPERGYFWNVANTIMYDYV